MPPRLTAPGNTDLHWMSVVCTPEATHVEFHEDDVDAMDAARSALATGVSSYVGRVTHQGEHTSRSDSKTVVLELRIDAELYEAIKVAVAKSEGRSSSRGTISRKGLKLTLLGWVNGHLQAIRDEYKHGQAKRFEPWQKCKSIDECEAMGYCCNGCQGKL